MRVLSDAVWPHIRGIFYHERTENHVLETRIYFNVGPFNILNLPLA